MKRRAPGSFGAELKALREAAGFTQEELATIAGLSVHAVSALERGERRRPHVDTVRALAAALDLSAAARDALLEAARAPARDAATDELSAASLPHPLTTLLGREADLRALQDWLSEPAVRLVTLVGPGGVGKSRLALEVVRAIAAAGTSRVAFASLASLREPRFVAAAVGEALGLVDVTAIDLPLRARLACSDSPTVLLVDNFEHLLDAAPLIGDLLRSVPLLRVLTTSRAPLRLRGEREYPLGPLALTTDDLRSPADLVRCPAVRLMVERIREVQPDFRLTTANGPVIVAICRRLDALPLALELAAPWIKVLTPEGLLHRLEQDVLLPGSGARDLPERQRTMNATIAWSYQLLDGGEQRAFRRLGALPGAFAIDAAAAVLSDSPASPTGTSQALGTVAGLIDRSLLLRSAGTPTRPLYSMMETVRAYAASELVAAGERDEAMEGLVRYCLSEATRAAEGLVGKAQAESLDRVRQDLETYRSVMAWLIDTDRPADAGHIASCLMFFWLIRGRGMEGLEWYERILASPALTASAEARVLVAAGMLWYSHGALDRASDALARAFARADSLDDHRLVAEAEHLSGHVEHALGHAGRARDRFAHSAEGFRRLDIPWGVGSALTGLAWVAIVTSGAADAERLLDQATAALVPAGPWFLSLVRYLRAVLAVRRGAADEALGWVRESLTCIRELQDRFAFVYSLVPLAAAAVLKGDYAWATRILGARDAVTERTGARVVDRSIDDLIVHVEQQTRGHLAADRWAHAYASGRRISIEALLNDIDEVRV